nr:MAG TPA: hypothetical protein [Caudoviricetes sp.]
MGGQTSVKIEFTAPAPIGGEAYVLTRSMYEQDFAPHLVFIFAYEISGDGKITARVLAGVNRIQYVPIRELFSTEEAAKAAAPEYLKKYGGGRNERQ